MNRICMLLLGYALFLFPMAGSQAQALLQSQAVESGIGIVCDTQAQIERLIALAENDARAALDQVNDEAGKIDACVIAPLLYIAGAKVARVTNGLGSFDVVEILVVGIATPRGARVFTEPVVWFTVFQSDGKDI